MARGKAKRIGPKTLAKLPPRQRQTHARSLRVLGHMRNEGMSLSEAARLERTTPATVRAYAGRSLDKDGRRWRARRGSYDRTPRPTIETLSGGQLVDISGLTLSQAQKLSDYRRAVGHYLATGDDWELRRFEGMVVAGYELEADADAIDVLAGSGLLDDWDLYKEDQ